MIDYIVLAKNITIFDALRLKRKFGMETKDSSQAFTRKFQKQGISKLSVWIDRDRILEEPDIENCTLNATIRTNRFIKDDTIDVEKIIATLDEITYGIDIQDKDWKLQNVAFKFWFACESTKDYMEMLNQGSFQSKNGLKKETDKKINPTELRFSGSSIRLKIVPSDDEQEIEVSMMVYKAKLAKLPEQFAVEGRLLKGFEGKFADLEMYLWGYYLETVFGMGNYYTYKAAEDRIEQSSYSRTEKNNMLDILKGISIYKGIEKYMAHLGEEDNEYDFMHNVKTFGTASKYLRILRNKLDINPVTIGRRTASNFFLPEGHFIGLVQYVSANEVHMQVKRKWTGQNKQEQKLFMDAGDELPFY